MTPVGLSSADVGDSDPDPPDGSSPGGGSYDAAPCPGGLAERAPSL